MQRIIFLGFLLACNVIAMEETADNTQDIHVVYSHAWCEDTAREIFKKHGESNKECVELSEPLNPVLIFNNGKSFESKNSKTMIYIGDDGTTFCNSHSMKFAFLGNSLSMVTYPDENNKLLQATLYTQPAVMHLADHLYDRVIREKRKKIVLVGPCMGASIIVNCLKKLGDFQNNRQYFHNSAIKTQEDAQQIIAAINNGGLVLIVPLMKLQYHNALVYPAIATSSLMCAALSVLTYLYISCLTAAISYHSALVASIAAGLIVNILMSSMLERLCTTCIQYCIVPLLSTFHYNPFDEDPIDNIESLSSIITCPTAISFTHKDGVMQWKNNDLLRFCQPFINNNKSMISITNDAGHMQISPFFLKRLQHDFKPKLTAKKNNTENSDSNAAKEIKSLKEIIANERNNTLREYLLDKKNQCRLAIFLSAAIMGLTVTHR